MKTKWMLVALVLLVFASPVFGQTNAAAGGTNWVAITSGFAMAIASLRSRQASNSCATKLSF